MNEKNTILTNRSLTVNVTPGLPKTSMGQLIGFFSHKLKMVSDFAHKWAKP